MAMARESLRESTRDPAQIRADIERTRAQLVSEVAALGREVSARADWRTWVAQRPGLCLGAAFAVGMFIGLRG